MIVCNRLYFKSQSLITILALWLIFAFIGNSQTIERTDTLANALQQIPDSVLNALSDSAALAASDTILNAKTNTQKPNQIDAEIKYVASDSIVFLSNGTAFLHGETDINYKNINLKADFVRVKLDSNLIYARPTIDSLGARIGEPIFSEGEKSYTSRELTYNLKTKKGYIRQAVTQEGEGYIISDRTKKSDEDVLCIAGGKYTTCDNHDHPHFYLSLSKGKIKPGEYIVAGPAHLVIADVPLPIAVPFGFFPFTDKYSSGLLMPSYTDELTRGFGLQNGGWYFAINDYVDLELRGDIYTKGTWAIRGTSSYVKKYKFRGSLGIEFREDVTGEKDMPDYNSSRNFSIRWSHSQDQKANPNFSFSSSVNFSTSGFNRSNINSYARPELNSQNTTSSSINFTKRFPNIPSLSISGGMSLTQRTRDSTISMSLPNINISYSRFYPFKRKEMVGKERWYEKISMSYSGAISNSVNSIKENQLLKSSLQRDWKNGMRHNIPISATFNLLKYINISPSMNYTERWYLQSTKKHWDANNQKEIRDTVYGFNRVYDFNMGVSASTKLYGFYQPIRAIFGDKIDRIRHVMSPSIGFGYTPDFGDPMWGYYDSYTKLVRDASNPLLYTESEVQYSRYEGSLYGAPGRGKSGSLNFSLGNNVEMKVRNDRDTTGNEPFKKISLIDNLSLGGSYNMAVDTMRWSMISANIRLKLTKSYALSLSTSFDPYMYGLNSTGNPVRINKLRWENGMFPRFQGTSTSYSYTFNNDTFKKLFGKKTTGTDPNANANNGNMPGAENNQNNPDGELNTESSPEKTEIADDGYAEVTIPWSFTASYSIRYGNTPEFDFNKMDYKMDFTHNLSLNGSITLTNNWRITANSSYDFKVKQFTYTSINVNRSLHCWSMSASIVPFGTYKSYSFHIGVNSSMLADLKYDKQSEYGRNVITWY
ncbi:MAG: LPS-assembly protein LptD [Paludibacteraceae bacterium]|nr:LPS-assembly protein LptD [Paludibacteraceae bacterium]